MGYALLIPKGKKTLGLKLYSSDFGKLHLEGKISLRKGRMWNLFSRRFSRPLPKKDLLRLLREQEVIFSSQHRGRLEPIVRAEKLGYKTLELCSPCLNRGKIKTVGSNYYLLYNNRLCSSCAREELRRELKFRDFSKSSFEHFAKLLEREKNLEKVFFLLQRQSLSREHTLFDRVEKEEGRGTALEELHLHRGFEKVLRERGIKRLTPVQKKALEDGVMEGSSLLVTSSTASGKTLIAEIAGVEGAMKGKKFLFLVPLVALANQKYQDFNVYSSLGLKVALKVGKNRIKDKGEPAIRDTPLEGADIIVGTYEGVDQILRSGKKNRLGEIGVIAVDEVHTLSQEERGVELDGFLSRLREEYRDAQIIALTATLGNATELGEHYSLKPIVSEARPIPLERHLIFPREEEKQEVILKLVKKEARERSSKGFYGQSLVFTNSRRKTHSLRNFLSSRGVRAREYHSGLSYYQRKKIEKSFLRHELDCVVTTAALGAGIDFPASQVIFERLAMGNQWLEVKDFLQMTGRAGRPSYHDRGKVVLLAVPGRGFSSREREDQVAVNLLSGSAEEIEVTASKEEAGEQLLGCIASAGSIERGLNVARKMLLSFNEGKALEELKKLGMLEEGKLSPLGKLAARHFLKPGEAWFMYSGTGSPERILTRLFPFTNSYVSGRMATTLSRTYGVRVPLNYFDAMGILFQEPREELMEVVETVREEFMSCTCEIFPYCDHAQEELSRKIIALRREGEDIKGVARALGSLYLETFTGDIYGYLDTIVRKAEGLKEILQLRKSPKAREVENLIKEVQG